MIHSIWIWYQCDPLALIETITAPVMVAAHQVQPAIQKRNQAFYLFPLAQRQVANVEDHFLRLDETGPIFNDLLLPVIRTVAITANVLVEEMGGYRSGDDPGLVIKGDLRLGQ
jgi:hypothetical protein